MKNLLILALFYLISISPVMSQEKNPDDIIDNYLKELKLDRKQKKQFTLVLKKYASPLNSKALNVRDYNALMKEETLEIYGILSPEQFSVYKKLKKTIEPSKKYKFESN